MSDVARSTKLGRESLYKALQADAMPRFATVRKVMSALGLELTVAARKPAPAAKRVARKQAPAASPVAVVTKRRAKTVQTRAAARRG